MPPSVGTLPAADIAGVLFWPERDLHFYDRLQAPSPDVHVRLGVMGKENAGIAFDVAAHHLAKNERLGEHGAPVRGGGFVRRSEKWRDLANGHFMFRIAEFD